MSDIITLTNKRNWAGLIGGVAVAAALLYPFVSIGDKASPFDHYLNAAYGYDNPDIDYGDYAKERTMMHALPFQEGPENGVILNTDTEVIEVVEPVIDVPADQPPVEPIADTAIEPIVEPIETPPQGSSVFEPFQGHMLQGYPVKGHQ